MAQRERPAGGATRIGSSLGLRYRPGARLTSVSRLAAVFAVVFMVLGRSVSYLLHAHAVWINRNVGAMVIITGLLLMGMIPILTGMWLAWMNDLADMISTFGLVL